MTTVCEDCQNRHRAGMAAHAASADSSKLGLGIIGTVLTLLSGGLAVLARKRV